MYANFLHNYPTLTPTLSSIHAFTPKNHFTPNLRTEPLFLHLQPKKSRVIINCAANSDGVKGAVNWAEILDKWSPKKFLGADKLFRAISGATSSPIAQYIPAPFTFVHSVDPRIKLDQLGRVTLLSGILFIMLGLSTDSAPSLISSRAPPPSMMGLPSFPASLEGYKYVILKLGPLQLTRKGLSTATTSACLTFTIFQSASVFLSTTTPEQIAFALRWFISPLANLGVPVAEVILTLLLSLRFINLVFDEVRNVALGIVSRRINWQQMTMLETIDG